MIIATTFYEYYATYLRGSLFSGFLTLTGFLFSVKTFIVLNMKKELYDTKGYKTLLADKIATNPNLTVYGPLQRLSKALIWSVLASLVTAVSQLTIGLWPSPWSAATCLSFAGVTIVLLVIDLWMISCNLKKLFRFRNRSSRKWKRAQLCGGGSPTMAGWTPRLALDAASGMHASRSWNVASQPWKRGSARTVPTPRYRPPPIPWGRPSPGRRKSRNAAPVVSPAIPRV